MRLYEGIFIIDSSLDEKQRETVQQAIEGEIARQGGEVVKREPWGVRSLAYPIKKKGDGFYWLIHFKLDPSGVAKIGERYKLNDSILRCLFVVPEPTAAKEVAHG